MTKKKLIYKAPTTTMEELVEEGCLLTASIETLKEDDVDETGWENGSSARQQNNNNEFSFEWD